MSFLWIVLPLASVGVVWTICAALARPARGEGSRFATGALALVPGILALLVVLAALELVRLAAGHSDPSSLLGIVQPSPGGGRTVEDATLAWGLLGGLGTLPFLLGSVIGVLRPALRERGGRFGGGGSIEAVSAASLALCGFGLGLAYLANPGAVASVLPPELASGATLGCLALALRLTAQLNPYPEQAVPLAPPQPVVGAPTTSPDPVALLRAAELVSDQPQYEFPAGGGPKSQGSALDGLWSAVSGGGSSGAPDGLAETLQAIGQDESVLVPDLPGVTEERFLAAALTHAALAGRRSLVITERPEALRQQILSALRLLGQWPPGAICASPAQLADLSASSRLPAILLLDPASASNLGVPYLAGPGKAFADALSLVVLSRPDRLAAVPSAHLHFTMARLALHPRAGGAPRAALVTAQGTMGILVCIQAMLGEHTRRVPLSLRARDRVRLFAGRTSGGTSRAAIVQAVREAVRVLRAGGVSVSIEDSADLLNAEDLGPDQRRVDLDIPGTLRADVCLCVVGLRQVSPLYRVAKHREPTGTPHGQIVVEWVAPSPLANFLTAPGRLSELARLRGLPAPMPLSGASNKYLTRLHLTAALHEGNPWETALREAFRTAAVSSLIAREDAVRGGRRARLDTRRGRVERSWTLQPAAELGRPDTARETVTSADVRVVDGAEGSELMRIDKITAATHYYPYRVFGQGGRRFHVPAGGGLDERAGTVTIWPVGEEREPTVPGVGFVLQLREWVGEYDRLDERGISLVRRRASVRVTERVGSAIETQSGRRFSFEPVEATYNTDLLVVQLEHLAGRRADQLQGLPLVAALLDEALLLHFAVEDDKLRVEALPSGFAADAGGSGSPSLAFIDRHIGGIGMADALTPHLLGSLFKWSRSALHSCPCMDGCERCTPGSVLGLRAKQDAIQMMGS
jgi:hypothetical protein